MTSGVLLLLALLASTSQSSGTPTTAGAYTLTVQVSDSPGQSSSANSTINIANQPTLSIVTASLPSGTVGAGYAGTLQATGGTQPYSWSIASGQLPGGLSLNATTGILSGTPAVSGSFSFTVQVADATSQDASVGLVMTIASAPSGLAPSAYTSRTDINPAPETIPTLCSPAPCSMTSSDLNAGTVYVRLTDNNTSGDAQQFFTNGDASQKEWNSNGTSFYVVFSFGSVLFYKFNPASPETASPIRCSYSGQTCRNRRLTSLGFTSNSNVAFSAVSPYVVYGLSSSLIVKMDFSATVANGAVAPTIATVADMSTCPGLPGDSTTSEFFVNGINDSEFVVATNGAGQNLWDSVYTYNTSSGCRWLRLSTMAMGGNYGPSGNATMYDEKGTRLCSGAGCSNVRGSSYLCSQIHNAEEDEEGRWAHIGTECGNGSPSNLNPHWDAFWDIATGNVYYLGDSGGGVGPYYGGGHSVMGFDNLFINSETDYAGHCFAKRTIPPTGANNAFLRSANCGALGDMHFSMANQTKGNTQPAIVGLYNSSNGFVPSLAWDDEILGLTYDGSGTVYRFAHAYTRGRDGFNSLIFAHVSRDGKWALFCSDWGGTPRDDVFLVRLK